MANEAVKSTTFNGAKGLASVEGVATKSMVARGLWAGKIGLGSLFGWKFVAPRVEAATGIGLSDEENKRRLAAKREKALSDLTQNV